MENYIKLNLDSVNFDSQDLSEVIFDRCNLRHCSFKGCKMVNTIFSRCNVIACDFTDVDTSKIIKIKSNFNEEDIAMSEIPETEDENAVTDSEGGVNSETEENIEISEVKE